MGSNWNVLGHEWAVRLLQRQIASRNFRHAYLITGPEGVGRRTLALRLAQALNCAQPPAPGEFCGECRACRGFARTQHPDLLIVERAAEDREIKIAAIRELSRSLSRTPLEAKIQIGLQVDFHLANEEASNALLKTLEEPNPSVVICLTAPDADSLPATIVSRCELLRLRPMSVDRMAPALAAKLSIDDKQAKMLAGLSAGCVGVALHWHSNPVALEQHMAWLEAGEKLLFADRTQRFAFAEKASKDREILGDLLLAWLSLWRDLVICASRSEAAISNPDHKAEMLQLADRISLSGAQKALQAVTQSLDGLKTNVNARLALEGLLLDIPSL